MIITKEQQEAWLIAYQKTHNTDECYGFIDGINKLIEFIVKKDIENLNQDGDLR